MEFNELSDDLKAKAIACKTPEEMLALAQEEGYELSEEELDGIAGGGFWGCSDYCSGQACQAVCGAGCGIVGPDGNPVQLSGDAKVFLM